MNMRDTPSFAEMTDMTPGKPLLEVDGLRVDVGERNVLESVSFEVRAGDLLVLMGANGSGKSTLGLTLAGHPRYRVTGGRVRFDGQDLLALEPEARARAGLFLSFQSPPDIPGVKNNLFLRSAVNAVRQAREGSEGREVAPLDAFDFLALARAEARRVGLPEAMLSRSVNDGFSGGERKRNELLQLALLKPRLAILDEADSGMDVDGVRALVELVGALREQGSAFIVVSHYQHLIEQLRADAVLQLAHGRITRVDAPSLAAHSVSAGTGTGTGPGPGSPGGTGPVRRA